MEEVVSISQDRTTCRKPNPKYTSHLSLNCNEDGEGGGALFALFSKTHTTTNMWDPIKNYEVLPNEKFPRIYFPTCVLTDYSKG